MSEPTLVESGTLGRVAYTRIAPDKELLQGMKKRCLSEGFQHAFVRGALGSLVDACLRTQNEHCQHVKGLSAKIASRADEVNPVLMASPAPH